MHEGCQMTLEFLTRITMKITQFTMIESFPGMLFQKVFFQARGHNEVGWTKTTLKFNPCMRARMIF